MKSVLKITESEWKVMDIIWRAGKLSAAEIVIEITKTEDWNDKTVRTLIKRLVDKNILEIKKEKVNIFYPLITKEECVKKETENFLKKMYNGSLGLLVSNFVKNEELSKVDIDILKELLENSGNKK